MIHSIFATREEALAEAQRRRDEGANWYRVEFDHVHDDYRIRETPCFRIVRFFESGLRRTIRSGLTRSEAQAHCNDPETSSSTATGAQARRRTARSGRWFDGFTQD